MRGHFLVLPLLAGVVWAAEPFSAEQLKSRFYYDLGPAEVDVSAYPARQQANYMIFAKTCGQCHTLARPINSPLSARKDWKRFVRRMHLKTKLYDVAPFPREDAEAILEFLAYDSRLRKVERRAEFEKRAGELKRIFALVREERLRRQVEADKAKVKPDLGSVQPNPRP